MIPKRIVVFLMLLVVPAAGATDEPVPRADEVLDRAIAYHDPNAVWGTGALRLSESLDLSAETRERLGFERMDSEILIDHERGAFRCTTRTSGGDLIEYLVTGDEGETRLNGSSEYAAGDHPLLRRPSAEEAPRHRNLDVYVLGLPMKLRDAGTRVHPEVLVEEVR
ncbi:MAG TPA: hypothetical protein VMP42_09155, partial [Actinomycetota bacterium]|nr:hypothetical protein [Actinomycetota bacterium]